MSKLFENEMVEAQDEDCYQLHETEAEKLLNLWTAQK